MKNALLLLLLASTLPTLHGQDFKLLASEKGVLIDAGSAGPFLWPAPKLRMTETDYQGVEATIRKEENNTVVAAYPGGMEVRMTVGKADHTIRHTISNPPASAWGLQFQMQIPIQFRNGGQFAFGPGDLHSFPEKAEKQIVGEATARDFRLVNPLGAGFSIRMPVDYQQVQDNRVFNWSVFMYFYNYTFASQGSTFEISLNPYQTPQAASQDRARAFLVDRFGQSARKDYPGKVGSEEELKADILKEKVWLEDLPQGPKLDSYGGLAGSGQIYRLEKTGFFHVAKAGGRRIFVTPEGNAFFQLGVCTIAPLDDYTLVRGRESTFEWIPESGGAFASAWRVDDPGALSFYLVNWIRKHGRPFDQNAWSAQAVERLRNWGFNSGGAWTQPTRAMDESCFPYALMLPIEFIPGLPKMQGIERLFDPFAPESPRLIEESFARDLPGQAQNPGIIGYFMGNEQLFENVPKVVPGQDRTSPSKLRLVAMLKDEYQGDISQFNEAWKPETPLASFEEMTDAKLFVTTEAAETDMKAFQTLFLEKYYSTVHDLFRKYDKNHLLLGSRWQPQTTKDPALMSVAARYNDVVSVNYYTQSVDSEFLQRIHKWSSHKPLLLSEWHYTASDQGLSGGMDTGTQKDRGLAYRNYVESAAALPFVVGTQWFSYLDQSITGRWFEGFNGEGANIGLVSVTDRPYADFLVQAKATNDRIYEIVFGAGFSLTMRLQFDKM